MPYLTHINPSSGHDAFAGNELLSVFAFLRLELDERRLCAYDESDPLYRSICNTELLLRDRMGDESYIYTGVIETE